MYEYLYCRVLVRGMFHSRIPEYSIGVYDINDSCFHAGLLVMYLYVYLVQVVYSSRDYDACFVHYLSFRFPPPWMNDTPSSRG